MQSQCSSPYRKTPFAYTVRLERGAPKAIALKARDGQPFSGTVGVNILLVEDNWADARMIARAFRQDEATVFTTVATLREAQAALGAGPFDAVLTDLGLPDGNGLEVVQRLLPFCLDTPLLVLSGMEDERVAQNVLEAGAADFLLKGSLADLAKVPRRVYRTLKPHRIG